MFLLWWLTVTQVRWTNFKDFFCCSWSIDGCCKTQMKDTERASEDFMKEYGKTNSQKSKNELKLPKQLNNLGSQQFLAIKILQTYFFRFSHVDNWWKCTKIAGKIPFHYGSMSNTQHLSQALSCSQKILT